MLERAKRIVKNKVVIFVAIFMILNAIGTFCIARQFNNSIKLIALILFIEIIVELIFAFIVFRSKRISRLPFEKKFLFLLIPLGLFFTLIIPADRTVDNLQHTRRAFSVSNGQFVINNVNSNGEVSVSLPVELKVEEHGYEHHYWESFSGETYELSNTGANNYHFILYLPHALGILIGKILHLPLFFVLLLGRLFGFAAFAAFAYFALKITPRYKTVFAFVMIFPMTLQLVTAISSEPMIFGISFLLIAYAFNLMWGRQKNNPLSHKQVALIYILATAIALCKIVYLPLCALFLLVPYQKFGSKKRKWLNAIFATLLAAGLFVLWNKLQPSNYSALNSTANTDLVLHHPFTYLRYFFMTTFDISSGFYLSSLFGNNLGHFWYPSLGIYTYLAIIFSTLLLSKGIEHPKIKISEKLTAIVCFAFMFFVIATIMYTQWAEPGSTFVDGVQGRYFIPIIMLVPLMFISGKKSEKPTFDYRYPMLFMIFFDVCALVSVYLITPTL